MAMIMRDHNQSILIGFVSSTNREDYPRAKRIHEDGATLWETLTSIAGVYTSNGRQME